MVEWVGQLSTNKTRFCRSFIKFHSISRTHSLNNMLSIQHFFWLRFWRDKCFTRLRYLGDLALPMTNIDNFSQLHYCCLSFQAQLAVLLTDKYFIFEMEGSFWLYLIKQAKSVHLIDLVQLIFREDGWQRGLLPWCSSLFHILRRWLVMWSSPMVLPFYLNMHWLHQKWF